MDPRSVAVATMTPSGVLSKLQTTTTITSDSPEGIEVLLRSACVIVGEAVHRVTGGCLHVRHGSAVENTRLCGGYFAEVPEATMTPDLLKALHEAVMASVAEAAPIDTRHVGHSYLRDQFVHQKNSKSAALLDSLNRESYRCHVFGRWHCLAHDHVVTPDSSLLGFGPTIELMPDPLGSRGFWIRLQSLPEPLSLPIVSARFAPVDGGNSRGDAAIDPVKEPMAWVEAEERRFSSAVNQCAETIHSRGASTKLILISGPSASGKTTFSHRLALSLRALGRHPTVLSLDDYYRDASEPTYPRMPDGKPNHEVVDCLRLDDFAEHMKALFDGEEIETPIFDMKVSKPKPVGRRTFLPQNGILIMEGIFALAPKLTAKLDAATTFKIFIVPLPQTNVDELTFLSNQTVREIRRIVRDFRGRGRDAAQSIVRGSTVRMGEEQSIFPNLRHADYVFNSTMGHELAVLHSHCMTLLRAVKPSSPAHGHAHRLENLLSTLASVSEAGVPPESLIREFIGGSVFDEEDDGPQGAGPSLPAHALRSRSIARIRNNAYGNIEPAKSYPNPPRTVRDALALADPDQTSPLKPLCDVVSYFFPEDGNVSNMDSKLTETVAGLVNGELQSLDTDWPASRGVAQVEPVAAASRLGLQVHRATLAFLVHAACKKVSPEETAVTLHGFGLEGTCDASAYYVETFYDVDEPEQPTSMTAETVAEVAAEVQRMIDEKTPIEEVEMTHMEATSMLYSQGSRLAARLLNTCNHSVVRMVRVDGFYALALQPVAPHAGMIRLFKLVKVGEDLPGFAICFPTPFRPASADVPRLHEKVLTEISNRRRSFEKSHGATCVADINRAIARGDGPGHRRLAQAIDGMQVASVVARVKRDRIKVVFVAGASSSGKSVFADELQRQLRAANVANGRLSTDAWYRNLDDPEYPMTPTGVKDLEHVNALHLGELAEAINALSKGNPMVEPVFDLGAGRRDTEAEGRLVAGLPGTGVLIVEGLFALAPQIRQLVHSSVPTLGVMISPLTVVSLDEQRFVSGQVLRILRRIVRDADERGRDAAEVLRRWDSVSNGEANHAIPHLFEADVVVSATSLIEVNNLAARATALLLQVPASSPAEFFEARQLLALLRWAHPFTRC